MADRVLKASDLDPRTLRWVIKHGRSLLNRIGREAGKWREEYPEDPDAEIDVSDYAGGLLSAREDFGELLGDFETIAKTEARRIRRRR